ncbi:MAG: undecaprenyl-diphosphate phosphatase [Bacteroidales bacterium]|nr:undecaprenyl-diphosphate phosphatase [Bacteroidales bacterium]MDD3906847.1 undecaprenyl-diphosphate phosphatase [Bacteroidales bacterium]MDD4711763.1 undecaprenyl-diphosphate phosphatase [Bacteroidales bacterium]
MDLLMLLKAVIIGIVEGITEFLPISSTGHMILVDEFVKLSSDKTFTTAFEVIIQLGAIMSVVVFFWKDLWPFAGTEEHKKDTWQLWFKVIVGVIPAVVLGLLFDDTIEKHLFNPLVVAITLVVYGIILIVLERFNAGKKEFKFNSVKSVSFGLAICIGLFQCLAMVPGTSRSAATIIGAMLLGLSRGAAAEFSFFLAIPTMVGATALTILKNGLAFDAQQWIVIAVGLITSFIVAYAVIKLFMNFIRRHDFSVFGYYRIVLGLVVLLLLWNF